VTAALVLASDSADPAFDAAIALVIALSALALLFCDHRTPR
jgi:hypothetical protein